ncbi:hypothetical protein [Streptomyces sp. NPDC059009]|uniref:hypothetical protein n=1 Tax=Streptomyces sp. NPDC059009 TaxID=3346694 RepID=UPI00368EC6C5
MPAAVWILMPTYTDGPYELLRAAWITRVRQTERPPQVSVLDTRGDEHLLAHGGDGGEAGTPTLPIDFGLQLIQALDDARRVAQDSDSDRVVVARHTEDSWSWETYPLAEVPPAQAPPPEPPPPGLHYPPPPQWKPLDVASLQQLGPREDGEDS